MLMQAAAQYRGSKQGFAFSHSRQAEAVGQPHPAAARQGAAARAPAGAGACIWPAAKAAGAARAAAAAPARLTCEGYNPNHQRVQSDRSGCMTVVGTPHALYTSGH